MHRIGKAAVAVMMWAFAFPAQAVPDKAQIQAAQTAQDRGAEMYAYDQAAWHATDQFNADLKASGRDLNDAELALRGYVVEPSGDARLLVTFYGKGAADLMARARYFMAADGAVSGGLLGSADDARLSALALRLIAARDLAIEGMSRPDHALCAASPANTLVLPHNADGVISAYVLTSTIDPNIFPAGGHYRFDVGSDGALIGERRFMTGCFPIDVGKARKEKARMMVLSHLLDPQPTEIHAFVSRNLPFPLMIATTSNRAIWSVANGRIEYLQDIKAETKPR